MRCTRTGVWAVLTGNWAQKGERLGGGVGRRGTGRRAMAHGQLKHTHGPGEMSRVDDKTVVGGSGWPEGAGEGGEGTGWGDREAHGLGSTRTGIEMGGWMDRCDGG